MDDAIPAGDIGRAYVLLRVLSEAPGGAFDRDEYVQTAMESEGAPEDLLRGLGTLTDVFMSMFRPGGAMDPASADDEPDDEDAPPRDPIHMIVPAIVGKLIKTDWLPQQATPMMAGALTAAALGRNCYEWRAAYGPWQTWELLPWTYTPLFLADLIDFLREEQGYALNLLEKTLLQGAPPDH
jgi:hypothetical protein